MSIMHYCEPLADDAMSVQYLHMFEDATTVRDIGDALEGITAALEKFGIDGFPGLDTFVMIAQRKRSAAPDLWVKSIAARYAMCVRAIRNVNLPWIRKYHMKKQASGELGPLEGESKAASPAISVSPSLTATPHRDGLGPSLDSWGSGGVTAGVGTGEATPNDPRALSKGARPEANLDTISVASSEPDIVRRERLGLAGPLAEITTWTEEDDEEEGDFKLPKETGPFAPTPRLSMTMPGRMPAVPARSRSTEKVLPDFDLPTAVTPRRATSCDSATTPSPTHRRSLAPLRMAGTATGASGDGDSTPTRSPLPPPKDAHIASTGRRLMRYAIGSPGPLSRASSVGSGAAAPSRLGEPSATRSRARSDPARPRFRPGNVDKLLMDEPSDLERPIRRGRKAPLKGPSGARHAPSSTPGASHETHGAAPGVRSFPVRQSGLAKPRVPVPGPALPPSSAGGSAAKLSTGADARPRTVRRINTLSKMSDGAPGWALPSPAAVLG